MDEEISDMANEPNSIRTMKAYYSDRLYVRDRDSLMEELLNGNDRSLIITLASYAENAIELLIGQHLPALAKAEKKDWDVAFRHDGPLGTFSACIDMAFLLGLIDERLRGQLDDLRHMRNAVAHTKRAVTFEDQELKNVALRLFAPRGSFKLLNDTREGFRRTLASEGLLITQILNFGRDEAIEMCRKSFVEQGKAAPF